MKISWNWLNEYLTCENLTIEEASKVLTSIGLEVEAIETFQSIKGGLEHFYIGEVIRCEKHPNADKLSLTQVNLGENLGVKKIVCGAPNVAVGQKVAVAVEGAIIYTPNGESFSIKNSKIRGEESQGMICAEDELGIGEGHDGILVLDKDAEAGMPAADYFKIYTDTIFEIGLTPNRTDAMYHKGVARDLAAAINARGGECIFHEDGKTVFQFEQRLTGRKLNIHSNTALASKFGGITIENISINKTPQWMIDRLSAIGESPKHLLIDLTNYILHDLGQPLHAYDLAKLDGEEIIVDELTRDTTMSALNGQELKLKEGDIVIRDRSKLIGLAGIMGSSDSCIDANSQSIFIEVAYFKSIAIRQTSQRLSLRTEAAVKFEKGIDPNGTEYAIRKAQSIILSIDKSAIAGELIMPVNKEFAPWEVTLTRVKLDLYANMSIEKEKVDFILMALGIVISQSNQETWSLSVPRFKEDVRREEDVIEEVLRIYGYNLLPYPKFLRSNLSFSKGLTTTQLENHISSLLNGNGYQEIITNSISQSRYYKLSEPIKLLNSMTSELDCMRSSMLPGFLEVIEHNLNRDQKDLALFEIGNEYFQDKSGVYRQRKKLVLAVTGMHMSPNWQIPKGQPNDYFQLKSVIEKLIKDLKLDVLYAEAQDPNYNYGLQISLGQKKIGILGEFIIDKKMFDVKQKVFVAELDFDIIYKSKLNEKILFQEITKFPAVKRDLAMVINQSVPFERLESIAKKTLAKSLDQVTLFDIFKDKSLGESKKSYAIRLQLSNKEKTLSDKEIDSMIQKLIGVYQKELNAEIRS
jgi:phenylalanyl-tRNA synthetase beta chain